MDKTNLKKTVLITGGSRGIGRAIAVRLAEDGFQIVVNYKDEKDKKPAFSLAKTLARKTPAVALKADVAKEKEVMEMINAIKKKFGSLYAVVNNAGINQTETFENFNIKSFDEVLKTNLLGAALVTKYSLPLLEKSKSPRIIFISSINAFIGSPRRVAYVVSKSGILGLAKALALELAPKILINTVVPGYIDTKMFRKFTKESIREKIKRIPLGRIGEPEDIAGAVSFLCSDDAAYVTGQSFHVNGGLFLS